MSKALLGCLSPVLGRLFCDPRFGQRRWRPGKQGHLIRSAERGGGLYVKSRKILKKIETTSTKPVNFL